MRNLVGYKRFFVLAGIFLASNTPAVAQTPVPPIAPAQVRVVPAVTILRTVPTSLPATFFLRPQDPGNSPAQFSRVLAGAYENDHSLELLPPMEQVKTVFFRQSSLPLVQLWGGRLQLGAFQSTLHLQNAQLGPLSYRGMQDSHDSLQGFAGGPASVHLSGLSLSFHFGGAARSGHPIQPWQRLSRIVGNALN
jgi:hypothetical protein